MISRNAPIWPKEENSESTEESCSHMLCSRYLHKRSSQLCFGLDYRRSVPLLRGLVENTISVDQVDELVNVRGTDVNATMIFDGPKYNYAHTCSCLDLAVDAQDCAMVGKLLQLGAVVTKSDELEMPTLAAAACVECPRKAIELVTVFLTHGVHADAPVGTTGMRALYIATREQNYELMRLLLQHGADPNFCNNDYQFSNHSALGLAVARHDHLAMQILLEAGADPNWVPAGAVSHALDRCPMRCQPDDTAMRMLLIAGGNAELASNNQNVHVARMLADPNYLSEQRGRWQWIQRGLREKVVQTALAIAPLSLTPLVFANVLNFVHDLDANRIPFHVQWNVAESVFKKISVKKKNQ